MVAAAQQGQWEAARKIHLEMLEIHTAMFLEANPVPVKTAAALMGKCDPHLRLPLAPLTSGNLEKLESVMKKYQLI